MARYEVQVKTAYGWGTAGNWPARTLKEARKSLRQCSTSIKGGHTKDHRVVRLDAVVLAEHKATLRWDEATQTYLPLTRRPR